ncbi:MAG: hypothetical protein JJU45_04550 [Acidimicrobiia bacterium]|nr:hypothetical protein [Acidimicrobiia bacterium]
MAVRASRRNVLLGGGAVGVGVWAAPSLLSVHAAAAQSCVGCADGSNLIPNPSAETVVIGTDPDYDPVAGIGGPPPGEPDFWTTANGFRVLSYTTAASNGSYPSAPPTTAGGDNLFSGPIGAAASPATATTLDIPLPCEGEGAGYLLEGYLTGEEGDTMQLDAVMVDAADAVVATATIGPTTTTGLTWSFESITGSVPTTATRVRFVLTATRAAGNTTDYNHAGADELSFTLC